jgi:hypothetical protein
MSPMSNSSNNTSATKAPAKLNQTNYHVWKNTAKSVLIIAGKWPLQNPTELQAKAAIPADASINQKSVPAFVPDPSAITADSIALANIILLVEEDQLGYFDQDGFAHDAWIALKEQHEPHGVANKMFQKMSFYSIKKSKDISMTQHLTNFTNARRALASIQCPIAEEDCVCILMNSLDKDYKTLITTIEGQKDIPTLQFVTERIMHESTKLDHSEQTIDTAFPATQATSEEERTRNYNSKTCTYCVTKGRPGKGHLIDQCRSKRRDESYSRPSHHSANQANQIEFLFLAEATAAARPYRSYALTVTQPKEAIKIIKQGSLTANRPLYLESGASMHMSSHSDWLTDLVQISPIQIQLADSHPVFATHKGNLSTTLNGMPLRIRNVYFVPGLDKNLISISSITKNNNRVEFTAAECTIYNQHGTKIISAKSQNNLYVLNCHQPDNDGAKHALKANAILSPPIEPTPAVDIHKPINSTLWHYRLGHSNYQYMRELLSKNMVLGVSGTLTPPIDCVACALGKSKRHSFPASKTPKSIIPGEVTSFDYCGPMQTITPSGKRGFLGCIDQASGYLSPVLVNKKVTVFKQFKTMMPI